MATMTKEEALRYLESYALLNQITIEEQRRTPVEERLRQLAILRHAGKAMGWFRRSEEDEAVRNLWVKLKEKLGGRPFDEEKTPQSEIPG